MQDHLGLTRRRVAAFVSGVVMTSGAVIVMAQAGGEVPNAGSLAPVTAELRQLRMAVDELARSQTQAQALGVYLSAQQSRLLHVAGRLDAARRELEAVTLQSRQIAAELTNTDDAAQRSTKPETRQQLEMQSRIFKNELERVAAQLQQVQAREAELAQQMHAEEARWTDLIARLEQLVKK